MPLPASPITRAGFGRVGYCSLCAFADEAVLNERIKAGWNATQIRRWLEDKYGITISRPTIYRHKNEHLKAPEDRLVTAVEKTKAKGPVIPRQATNEQFLEAIKDTAFQRAVEHPDEVTIDHGLKAASILANSKRSGGDALIILARVMTGFDSGVVIEGEAREIENQ